MSETTATFFDRTIDRLGRALRGAAGSARVRLTGQVRPELPDEDVDRLKRQIDACLDGPGGEVSERARAADLGRAILNLSPVGRLRFFKLLAQGYNVDPRAIDAAIAAWQGAAADNDRRRAAGALRQALQAPWRDLLTKFNALPEGIKFLVDLRADLLGLLRDHPELAPIDDDLQDLLAHWFDIGFLDLARITWSSPAALLEKLIDYEAVHEIRSWSDLKNRLDSDRRCFAFFHPRMPDEPLIFVEVALVRGISGSVQALLDEEAPAENTAAADTAIFYSISNCQKGLSGVSFGNFLIKRVVERLRQEMPQLKTFATLSPIPGFRAWLDHELARDDIELMRPDECAGLAPHLGEALDGNRVLQAALQRADWPSDATLSDDIKGPLIRLCARYLTQEKKGKQALDRVAHFHLSNGARVERINWLGDLSPNGLARSYGLMVNYLYKLDEIEANHETYTGGIAVPMSGAIKRLA